MVPGGLDGLVFEALQEGDPWWVALVWRPTVFDLGSVGSFEV